MRPPYKLPTWGSYPMQTAQAKIGGTAKPDTLSLPSRLDSGTVSDFEQDAHNFIQNGVQELVLDGSKLYYLTATGLHAMLGIAKSLQQVQGKLSVCNLQGQPKDMFKACSFDKIIPLVDSEANEAQEELAA